MNPLAKFLTALVVAIALLASLNPFIAGGLLLVELVALPFVGLSPRKIARVGWPIAVAALLATLTTALYGRPFGHTYWAWGPILITEGSLILAVTIGLRVLAIGLPGVVLFATVDAVDLADALAQLWRLPQRFVYGALAAMRLIDVLAEDWQTLSLARRARGLGAGRLPLATLGRRFAQVFALFVLALRRGSTLALAMDARGFGAPVQRTYARPSLWRPRDSVLVTVMSLVAGGVIVLSVIWGSGVDGIG